MKRFKNITAAALAGVMLFGLAACGGEKPEEVIKKAQDALAEVTSFHADMSMEMNMSAGAESLSTTTSASIDSISDPVSLNMDMSIDMGELGSIGMEMYAVQDGSNYIMYASQDGGNVWYSQNLTTLDDITQYKADDSMNLYLSSIDTFKEAGTETIEGVETVRYEGVISKDAINEVMAASGVEDQLAQYGISAEDAAAMYLDLDEMPISLWIAKDTYYPMRYEMDMTAMMQKLMTNMYNTMYGENSPEVTIDKVSISLTLSNFNGIASIEVPQDVIDNAIPA